MCWRTIVYWAEVGLMCVNVLERAYCGPDAEQMCCASSPLHAFSAAAVRTVPDGISRPGAYPGSTLASLARLSVAGQQRIHKTASCLKAALVAQAAAGLIPYIMCK